MKNIAILFFMLGFALVGQAQLMVPSGNLGAEEGLAQNTAIAVARQKNGTLWVGTLEGLHRYNGSKFIKQQLAAMSRDFFVLGLCVDDSDNLWVFSRDAAYFYNGCAVERCPTLAINIVNANVFAYKGGVAVNTKNGVEALHVKDGKISAQPISHKSVIGLKKNDIALGVISQAADGFVAADTVAYLELDKQKLYFLNSGRLLYSVFKGGTKSLALPFMNASRVTAKAWTNNTFVVLADQKAWVYKKNKDGIWMLFDQIMPNIGLETVEVDRYQNLLVGSKTSGVYWFAPNSTNFVRIVKPEMQYDWIVWTIFELEPGVLLFGSNLGLSIFEARNGSYVEAFSLLENTEITDIVRCNGQIVLATNKGIQIYKPENQTVVPIEALLANENTYDLYCAEDLLFVGAKSRVFTYDFRDKTKKILPSFHSVCYVAPVNNNLLLCGFNGIYVTDISYNIKHHWQIQDKGVPANTISAAKQLRNNEIWVTTFGNGIYKMRMRNDTLVLQDSIKNLPSTMVYRLHEEDDGAVWASTNSGLSKILTNGYVQNFGIAQGQPIREFNQNSFLECKSGQVIFGGLNGAIGFFPNQIIGRIEPQLYRIENLEINFKTVLSNAALDAMPQQLKIGQNDRTITLEVAQLGLQTDQSMFYQLQGYDVQPRSYKNGEIIQYTNLPFDDFVLKIWATNGIEQTQIIYLPISRVPPIWLQLWFQLTVVGLVVLLLSGLIWRYRVRKLKQQLALAALENKVQGERIRISRDLHDNIGSQLTYVISTLDNLKYQRSETDKSTKLSDLSIFTREVMTQLRETIWALGQDVKSLEEMRGRLVPFLQKQGELTQAKILLLWPEDGNILLEPSKSLNVLRCIQEAIHNAIKYANASQIKVACMPRANGVYFEVEDDGQGFDLQTVTHGNGLDNLHQRMKDVGGECTINSSRTGTKVSLYIPLE